MASGGTVRDYPRMNAQEDAEVLEKAMKGMGMSMSYCMHLLCYLCECLLNKRGGALIRPCWFQAKRFYQQSMPLQ